jgi:hypothetical protein
MSLDGEVADVVRFHCTACGKLHSLREVRKYVGTCHQCQGTMWNMVTEYREVEQNEGLMAFAAIIFFGPIFGRLLNRQTKMIEIETPAIPAEEAIAIAQAGFFKHGKWAYKYMELRRKLDGERDRQVLRERGGLNCKICDMFFMPAGDKPWTQSGFCSRRCSAEAGLATPTTPAPPSPNTATPRLTAVRSVTLDCSCGHQFEVAAMYTGTLRPCPKCQKKTKVP